jgi:hypothetical protein
MPPELEMKYLFKWLGDDPTLDEGEAVATRIVDILSVGAFWRKEQVRETLEHEAREHPFNELWFRCYSLLPEILGE